MEISTEINKIFGQEMARLYAETISEKEMVEFARTCWRNMLYDKSSGWTNRESEAEKVIRRELEKKLSAACEKILSSEEAQIDIEKKAKEMIDKIRQQAEEKIIERTSDVITRLYTGSEMGLNLRGYIQQVIMESLRQ